MNKAPFEEQALFEHRFWLQILGDHSRFILDALSIKEKKEIQFAHYFIQIFDQLLEQSRQALREEQIMALTQKAYHYAQEIRSFKLELIQKHLEEKIVIQLSPTFINHMVNEVEEYLRILQGLLVKKVPYCHSIHHHLLWLIDAAGHAHAIAGSLDMVEKKMAEKSKRFTQNFEDFHLKALEISGYMRTGLKRFPSLSRFNQQVEWEITLFEEYLRDLECLRLNNEVLGTLQPIMLDHMAREECYYLIKLSEVSEVKPPECDPTKPRTE